MFKRTCINFFKRNKSSQNLFKNSNVNIFKRNSSQNPIIQKEIKKEDIQDTHQIKYIKTNEFIDSVMTAGKYVFLTASIGEFGMQNYGLGMTYLAISLNTHLFQQMDEEEK